MTIEKQILDEEIFLYKKNIDSSLLNKIYNIENIVSTKDVWSKGCSGNINNVEHLYGLNILRLPSGDFIDGSSYFSERKVFEMLYIIKDNLIKHSIDSIKDYCEHFELNIKNTKNWVIASNKNSITEHDDSNKDGILHSHSLMILLNDNYSGGGLFFKDRIGNSKVEMSAGDIIIYPSNANYQHYELPIVSGNKYFAMTFF